MSQVPQPLKSKGGLAKTLLVAGAAGLAGLGGGVAVDRTALAPPPPTVYFSPNGGCTKAVVEAVDVASNEIRVQAYLFTSADIADALIRARQRHPPVKVFLLIDKDHGAWKNDQTARLIAAGVETKEDCFVEGAAHDKVMIIDRRKVITGSFNFTFRAENRNGENLVILERKEVTAQYLENWEKHWQCSSSPALTNKADLAGPISPEMAIQQVGQTCHVRMKVARAALVNGIVYLNYLEPYNKSGNLAIRVFPHTHQGRFATWPPYQQYLLTAVEGKDIEVVGQVKPYLDRYEIEVTRADQFKVLP